MKSPASAPAASGAFAVRTHTFEARDPARDRLFSCDIWCPGEPGAWPLVLYSHHSRGNRRAATYLATHLASHGYLVAALDHSEVIAPEIAGNVEGFIANRVPDARFLLDYMLAGHPLHTKTLVAIEPRLAHTTRSREAKMEILAQSNRCAFPCAEAKTVV
jgi:predicted dienelactone hydrolase